MASVARRRLESRLEDATRLLEIHSECTGAARGRRHGYDALNRSVILLSVAAWEGYAEDRLQGAAAAIARRLTLAAKLPSNVRDALLAAMHEEQAWSKLNQGTKNGIWALTDDGWRAAYIHYAKSKIDGLNTPDHGKLRKLYSSVIGLADLSCDWKYRRWGQADYIRKLDDLLILRHRIAHGSIGEETVGKGSAKGAVSLVRHLADWTDGTVLRHLGTLALSPIKLRRRK